MKKLFLIFVLCLCAIQSKAQVITGLDEVALLGDWHATDYWGLWENLDYRWPMSIEFNDNKKTLIYTMRSNEQDFTILDFNGYWIGGTATGRYTLHFICRREYDSSYTGLSMVNFVIKNFDGEKLIIETYDGSGGATFSKDDSGIENIKADAPEASSTLYNLNGISVKNPTTHGVYIQSDGKKIIK